MERLRYRDLEGLAKLAIVIGLWDTLRWYRGRPTFSNQFGALLVHPDGRRRHLAIWSWCILSQHMLCNLLPPPLRRTWKFPKRSSDA